MRCAWRVPAAVAAAVVALVVTGCSGEGKTGTVTGTVTVDGKPAEGIALTFAGPDGRVATAATDAQGHYQAVEVPVGPVTVTAYGLGDEKDDPNMIEKNRGAADPSRPPPPAAKKKPPKVAERFGDPNTSGLKHTATEGTTTCDIQLTSK